MTRVFIADNRTEERFALQLLLRDLSLEVVGEAADWPTTLAEAPGSQSDIVLVDWDLLPAGPSPALDALRKACPDGVAIVLISRLDAWQQAALSAGADTFISKGEAVERFTDRFKAAAASVGPGPTSGNTAGIPDAVPTRTLEQ